MSKTNTAKPFQIDPWQQIAFDAITANSDSICLVPCRVGGENSACICVGRVTEAGKHKRLRRQIIVLSGAPR